MNPDRIRTARQQAGLRQEDLACLIPCSARAIQSWEAGEREPRPHHRRRIAEVTGRDLAWFYELDEAVA